MKDFIAVHPKAKHKPVFHFRVNHWPASPPKFAGVMPVICDPEIFQAAMGICMERKMEWIEIVQVCRIGAN